MKAPSLTDRPVEEARGRLVDVVRLIHVALPDSDLPARQLVEIRRDLVFLVAESRREVFRSLVAEVLCTAVLGEVFHDHPELVAKAVTALRAPR